MSMPELPEHALPLQNLELERTDLFVREGKGEIRARILMGMRDPGEAAVLVPVLEQLKDKPVDIFMWTDSRAKEKFKSSNLGFKELPPSNPLISMSAIKGDLVVAGVSMNPGSEFALTENAHYDGVPVVWISDYVMGSVFARNKDVVKSNPRVLPDYLLVANEWVREQELKNLPVGFNPDRVIVTGQPAFDRLASEDREGTRSRVRDDLGISEHEKLVTYIGAIGEVSTQSLRILAEGLVGSGFEDYKLAIRRHPRDHVAMEDYLEIVRKARIGERLIDTSDKTIDEAVLSSDLVVNTLSTTGMESVYRGIPVLHVWIEDFIKKSELEGAALLPPIVEDGTSPAIFNEAQSCDVLRKLLTNENYILELKEKMARWKIDGHAAERASNFILGLLNKSGI